jgi:ribosomal protein L40E
MEDPQQSPEAVKQTVAAAAIALKFRPVPVEATVEMQVCRCGARFSRGANACRGAVAVYFLKCRSIS